MRLVTPAQRGKRVAPAYVRLGVFGIDPNRPIVRLQRLGITIQRGKRVATEQVEGGKVGFQTDRPIVRLQRLGIPPHPM